jgi:hypothetical protein
MKLWAHIKYSSITLCFLLCCSGSAARGNPPRPPWSKEVKAPLESFKTSRVPHVDHFLILHSPFCILPAGSVNISPD